MKKIISIGEVLIDLTQTGADEKGNPIFAAYPGGAPANVAVAAARLGAKAGFAGKIGSDGFGDILRDTLEKEGVDTTFLYRTDEQPTTLAIVHVDEMGERSFSFYRNPGADTQITEEEALAILGGGAAPGVEKPAVLHFGSLSLTTEPSRSAVLKLVEQAKAEGVTISYDPNYRPALWDSLEAAVEMMKEPLAMVDILKIADNELEMLTGETDPEKGSKILLDMGISLVMITLGSEGVYYRFKGGCGKVAGEKVRVADTNGAGDTFLGAVLSKLTEKITDGIEEIEMEDEELQQVLSYGNRAAALTCSRPGAIPAMPYLSEMEEDNER